MPLTSNDIENIANIAIRAHCKPSKSSFFKRAIKAVRFKYYLISTRLADTFAVLLGKKYAEDFENYNDEDY